MMRNNLLNFAEFERETIAARVADAYRSKARETGFYQGGKIYYGYCSERRNVNGKTGSVLVPSAQAESVRIAYELYSKPDCSLQNIIEYFRQNDIDTKVLRKFGDSNVGISHLSRILKNPLYVRADKDVYRYFASQDIEILDDVEAYDGIHGLFLHNKMDKAYLKVGYHEGLVDSATWLAVQERKSQQIKFPKTGKAITSWLVGLVRCPHCGHSYYVFRYYNNDKEYRYFRDGGYFTVNGCVRRTLKTQPDDVERIVFEAIKERISQLEIEKKNTDRVNPEAERIEAEIIRIDTEVSSLLDKLSFANDALFNYINKRAEELHRRRYDLQQQLRRLLYNQKSVDKKPLSEPLEVWDSLTAQEKNNIAKKVIDVIFVSDETGIDIRFSI